MYLKRVEVEGYRAAAASPIVCEFGGRFSLVLSANGAEKTIINEAITTRASASVSVRVRRGFSSLISVYYAMPDLDHEPVRH